MNVTEVKFYKEDPIFYWNHISIVMGLEVLIIIKRLEFIELSISMEKWLICA